MPLPIGKVPKKNMTKWVLLFLAILVFSFLIFCVIPLFLGFPKHLFPILLFLGGMAMAWLSKKFL